MLCTDAVKSVELVPPAQLSNNEVPIANSLLFSVAITSEYKTDMLDIRDYQWDFGDGSSIHSDLPAISHTYTSTGTYSVRVTVHAPFVSGSSEASLSFDTYQGEILSCVLTVDTAY